MHFIVETKGIELCHFPWALVNTFVSWDDILMSDWRLPSSSFLLSRLLIFHFFTFLPFLILVISLITSYGLRLSLSSLLMLWQKALFLLLQKDLRIRGFILWFEEFQNAFILRFECILPFSIMVMMSPIARYLVLCHLSWCHFYWISFLLLTFPAKKKGLGVRGLILYF